MKKPRVGFLPLYIKLYDDSVGLSYREPMERYMALCVKMLEEEGVEVVAADGICRIAPEFSAAADKFIREDVDAVVTMHLAYSPSLESIDSLLRLPMPLIVFDSTPDYDLVRSAQWKNGIDANHGIHGVQDMCSMLRRNGRTYEICAGHALHGGVIRELADHCRAAAAAKAFRSMTIGAVGGSFPGMGDFQIPDERLAEEIGACVKYMTPELTAAYAAKVTEEEIDAETAYDREHFVFDVKDTENYRLCTRSGLAVRKWMEDEGIGSVTVNFLTLDECGLPKMPFPECCKILGRGQGYAGEGDTLTAGLVGALLSAFPETTFTEMFCPDWEEDVILLSHMGESNPNLSAWRPHICDKPFPYNSCGDTSAVYGCYKGGEAVIVNLAPMKDHFSLILSPGEILEIGLEHGAYAEATQGWFRPRRPLPEFLRAYSLAGGTHHSAMVDGAGLRALEAFGRMMGFEVIVVK